MVNFMSYRKPHWNPDFDFPHLRADQEKYRLHPGIGATQHFCQAGLDRDDRFQPVAHRLADGLAEGG